MKIYIGYDEREERAVEVAIKSLRRVAPDLEPELLCAAKLTDQGLLWRVADHRGGQDYDLVSNAKKTVAAAATKNGACETVGAAAGGRPGAGRGIDAVPACITACACPGACPGPGPREMVAVPGCLATCARVTVPVAGPAWC